MYGVTSATGAGTLRPVAGWVQAFASWSGAVRAVQVGVAVRLHSNHHFKCKTHHL